MNDEYKNKLIAKYRTEVFEIDSNDISELEELTLNDSNEDLVSIFDLNMREMARLVNEKTIDKEKVRKLLIANINIYRIARKRNISLHGFNFLPAIADAIGYDTDKVYTRLSVGEYYRAYRPR